MAWRVTAACLLVALAAVGVAAVVSLQLVTMTARQVTRGTLAQQADVVAAQLVEGPATPSGGVAGMRRVVDVLRAQEVAVVRLGTPRAGNGPVGLALTRARADRARTGTPVSGAADVGGKVYLVEARPSPAGAFALVRSVDSGPVGALRRNVGLAVGVGVVVAVLVGAVVGRMSGRPLRTVAAAAHRLRGRERDVRVPVRGPAEVAEVAGAVNELADALARSEDRQRRFLLSVSHELRTPLTAVRGFGESLADGVVTGPDVRPAGATIVREAGRLDRLVTDLMELARLEADDFAVDPAEVDLAALVTEAGQAWELRGRDTGVVLHVETPDHPVPVRADPRRLRQVLDGLAENALRVTPAGAPLVLAARDGGVLQVRDGGPGLSDEDYAVVFERGALHDRYRGHRPTGTGGVGLALAHGLVTRMGGTISAAPAPEGGVAFTVTLAGLMPR
nr:HAMP domain-containing sensor histidine kinase [Pseudonocardia sp. C8]